MKNGRWIALLTAIVVLAALTGCAAAPAAQTEAPTQAPVQQTPGETAGEETGSSAPAEPEIKWSITIPGKSGSLCNTPTYVAYERGSSLRRASTRS